MAQTGTITLLFTDLVNSTELLGRAGDEHAQRIFRAHHKLLSDAVAGHGGHEVKWLGDGLMVAFSSAADAVRCAIAMQQGAQRPVAGARLGLRVGLHVGEALRDETDYFGTAVVVARRLCERASAGQIIASALVSGLLAGRSNLNFRDLGALELKGLAAPVPSCEVLYEHHEPTRLLRQMPFVGRANQMAALHAAIDAALSGQASLVMIAGEPGIGKTRLAEEAGAYARLRGAQVLVGRCYEGEAASPYSPFVEAIREYLSTRPEDALRAEMGHGASDIAKLVPEIHKRFADLPSSPAANPNEERMRLFDSVASFLVNASKANPLMLHLDDLHWADKASLLLLQHLARRFKGSCLIVVGTYRDVELDRRHPLSTVLAELRRERLYQRQLLRGLSESEVTELIEAQQQKIESPGEKEFVRAILGETEGNPFFIEEVLRHLVESGALYRREGRWVIDAKSIAEIGIPEGVRDVISRRLSRLSETCNSALAAAAVLGREFEFELLAP